MKGFPLILRIWLHLKIEKAWYNPTQYQCPFTSREKHHRMRCLCHRMAHISEKASHSIIAARTTSGFPFKDNEQNLPGTCQTKTHKKWLPKAFWHTLFLLSTGTISMQHPWIFLSDRSNTHNNFCSSSVLSCALQSIPVPFCSRRVTEQLLQSISGVQLALPFPQVGFLASAYEQSWAKRGIFSKSSYCQ